MGDAAAAQRRARHKIVREYLYSLEDQRERRNGSTWVLTPQRAARLEERIARLRERIAVETVPIRKLDLIADRIALEDELAIGVGPSLEEQHEQLEAQVIDVLGQWSTERGISWRALRQVGVPFRVLRAAGVDTEVSV